MTSFTKRSGTSFTLRPASVAGGEGGESPCTEKPTTRVVGFLSYYDNDLQNFYGTTRLTLALLVSLPAVAATMMP